MKLKQSTKRHIESEIMDYHKTKQELENVKQDLLYGQFPNNDENVGGGRKNLPTTPVENRVIARLQSKQIRRLETTLSAIESVYENLNPEKQEFLRVCFWERKYTIVGLASKFNISRRTAIRWKNEIIVLVAKEFGY